VKRYANEIVPSFNAYIYFRLGNWLSRSLLRVLYRVRVGSIDEEGFAKVDPQSSVVFVMNHRSNLDYILLACLAINRVAMSFAVGEWARVWPLQHLIRVLGGYFVRRGSGDTLYRSVLARYVQMATEGGVVQAIFPEGRLSKDGRLGDPKIGLLDYMLRSFDSKKGRDLVFIPVGVNYDRVLEDRSSLLSLDHATPKKTRLGIIRKTLFFIVYNLWLMLRGGWYRYGYAVVSFGTPISMRLYGKRYNVDFRNLDKKVRMEKVQLLAQDLMLAVGRTIPIAPVSLVASVFVENPGKIFSEKEIKTCGQSLISELEEHGARVYVPRSDHGYTIEVGLRMLTLRHLVIEESNLFRAAPGEIKVLHYYANAIAHHLSSGK
jgi:glycerol-3-phosphate O-acyltransferase